MITRRGFFGAVAALVVGSRVAPLALPVLRDVLASRLDVDISQVFASLEASVPVTHPRRLGVITGIVE